ncbi:MAG: hypothetical protein IPP37_07010 [Saprospiraceae bacterium]|nr:hypothetical protein [Saprospiraceae bacterium]
MTGLGKAYGGVIIYYYHTNADGRYKHDAHLKVSMAPKAGQTHGALRGWVKTNKKGEYAIYRQACTLPGRSFPAHIHPTLKEPNEIGDYYLDDIVLMMTGLSIRHIAKKWKTEVAVG